MHKVKYIGNLNVKVKTVKFSREDVGLSRGVLEKQQRKADNWDLLDMKPSVL